MRLYLSSENNCTSDATSFRILIIITNSHTFQDFNKKSEQTHFEDMTTTLVLKVAVVYYINAHKLMKYEVVKCLFEIYRYI